MKVEARLGAYIRENGICQSFVYRQADIDKDAFSRCLNGKQEMKLDEFERVCKALKKSPNDFIKPDLIE